jgi:hypothetical protein
VQLRLPLLYRGPYYLILAVFLLYPLALTPYLSQPRSPGMMWGLFSFASVAALAFLTLLPAIRRGPEYLQNNGSPWPWPLYPWSLFGLLALAVPGRAILLCYSLHLIDVRNPFDMTFGPYFLAPFGLAGAVLLLEAGIVTDRRWLRIAALALPIGLFWLALVGHRGEDIYRQFLMMFTDQFGADPAYWTLLLAAGFFVYATIRRVEGAFETLTATLVLLTFMPTHFLADRALAAPNPAGMIGAAALLLALGIWNGGSWRCLLGGCGLAFGVALAITDPMLIFPYRWIIAFHVMLTTMLIVGSFFDDSLGKALRSMGPAVALVICLAVMFLPLRLPGELPEWALKMYPLGMAILLSAYGLWLWHVPTLSMAGVILLTWSAASGWNIYRSVRTLVVGMDYLILSLLVFALAVLVSIAKSGLLSRWMMRWRREEVEPID